MPRAGNPRVDDRILMADTHCRDVFMQLETLSGTSDEIYSI